MEGGEDIGAAVDPFGPGDAAASAAAASAAGGDGGGADNNSSSSSSPAVPQVGDGIAGTTETVHSENGTPFTVKLVKATAGNNAKRSWVWKVMHEFTPSINGKNAFSSVCRHLVGWVSTSGTTGLTLHYKKKHPALYAEMMKKHTTPAQARGGLNPMYYMIQ